MVIAIFQPVPHLGPSVVCNGGIVRHSRVAEAVESTVLGDQVCSLRRRSEQRPRCILSHRRFMLLFGGQGRIKLITRQ